MSQPGSSAATDSKLCVLVPAYNCGDVLEELCGRIVLPGNRDEIIVVDDASPDRTVEVARTISRVHAVRNEKNLGYGGTSHRLYEIAVERGVDVALNIHGDLGHRPEDIPHLLGKLREGAHDIVVGSRLLHILNGAARLGWHRFFSEEVLSGMPWHRAMGHVGLTSLQNKCFGTQLHCFHDGMRAVNREVIDWALSNDFPKWYNYDAEFLVQAHRHGWRIGEVPVRPFYDHRAKSAAPPIRYGLKTVQHALRVAMSKE